MVDLENDPYKKATDCYGLGIAAMIAWIAGFTGRARALTGKWPIIYTTADWWRECTGDPPAGSAQDPLWLAAFGGTGAHRAVPLAALDVLAVRQRRPLPGIGQTDLDYYQPTGDLPALRAPAAAAGKAPGKARGGGEAKRHMRAGQEPHEAGQGQAQAEKPGASPRVTRYPGNADREMGPGSDDHGRRRP